MKDPRGASKVTPEKVLSAYQHGLFPMARGKNGDIHWYISEPRAIVPLDQRFKVRRSLHRFFQQGAYEITFDQDFPAVIRGCARHDRVATDEVWLSDEMIELYIELFHRGNAHSVEVWSDGLLVGGLYGVALQAVFFGESMFSTRPYASQVALVALVEHLRKRGYLLLDAQVMTPHLAQFGVIEMTHDTYVSQLLLALRESREFLPAAPQNSPA